MTTKTILTRYASGDISPEIALMEFLIELEDADRVRAVLTAANAQPLLRILDDNAPGCQRIATMLASGMDTDAPARTPAEGIAWARRLFDWSVRQSEEASVALYSLGNPRTLAAATNEIVEQLTAWNVLGRDRKILQIGCGIGRMEQALAPRVAEAHGLDVSPNMITAAERRCAGLANVFLRLTDGAELSGYSAGYFDLVYAVDSFPYIVQSGMTLVETHFAEAARVLRRDREFIILNFSYRDQSGDDDRRDVQRLAAMHGFDVVANGDKCFRLWDGLAFRLRRK